jgi:hypothetical protein
MTTNGYAGTTVAGVVEATNDRGLRLNGEWLNVSKFKPLELPPVGARVSVLVDGKGFLTSVQVLEGGVEKTPAVSRNETIARLAVLKAAAAFGASRPDLKSSDVLRIADAWLAWVEESYGT